MEGLVFAILTISVVVFTRLVKIDRKTGKNKKPPILERKGDFSEVFDKKNLIRVDKNGRKQSVSTDSLNKDVLTKSFNSKEKTEIKENEEEQYKECEEERVFDLREAIIYSEIMNNPFFDTKN